MSTRVSTGVITEWKETALTQAFEADVNQKQDACHRIKGGTLDGRTFHYYYISHDRDNIRQRIARAAWAFLSKRKEELLTGDVYSEKRLLETLEQKPYLVMQEWSQTIQGNVVGRVALCLARSPLFGTTDIMARIDGYFSGDALKEPFLCSQGHAFELDHIKSWRRQQRTDDCPIGEEHPLVHANLMAVTGGELFVDESLREKIKMEESWSKELHETMKGVVLCVQSNPISKVHHVAEGFGDAIGGGGIGAAIGTGVGAGVSALIGVPMGGAMTIGASVGGGLGLVLGGTVGSIFTLCSRFWYWVREYILHSPHWEDPVKKKIKDFLGFLPSGGRITKGSIESNVRMLKDSHVRMPVVDPTRTEMLLVLIDKAKDEVMKQHGFE